MVIHYRGSLTQDHWCMYESYFRNLDSFHLLRVLGGQISTKNWTLESLLWSMGKENQTCHWGPIVPSLRGPEKQWLRATHMAGGPHSWHQEKARRPGQRPRKEGVQSQDNFLQQKRCPFLSGWFFFLALKYSMQDLCSLTSNWTDALCFLNEYSYLPDCQRSPSQTILFPQGWRYLERIHRT